LQHRAVLGIDGNDFAATDARRLRHQVTGHHQGFLVGQGDALPCPKRGQGSLEAGGAHHGIHYDVRLGMGGGFDQHRRTGGPTRVGLDARQGGVRGPPLRYLSFHLLTVSAGGKRHQTEMLLLAAEHVERAAADRAGRPEQRDPSLTLECRHQITPKPRYSAAAVGMTK
jgi:hypothetical protein